LSLLAPALKRPRACAVSILRRFQLVGQLLQRERRLQTRTSEHATTRAQALAQERRLLTVQLKEMRLPVCGHRRFRHQPQLVVEHDARSTNRPARGGAMKTNSALHINGPRLARNQLLAQDERGIIPDPPAALVPARH
jgi:RecA/RadA recombinase